MAREHLWDSRYSESGFAYGTAPNDFLRENFSLLPPKGKVLCLAEGEGRNAVFLAKHSFEVVAVDYSEVGLQKARQLAEQEQVQITTILTDLADFVFEERSFDAVLSIFCHLTPDIRKRVHHNIPICLKPGGILLLEGYTPKQLQNDTGGPPKKEMMLTLEMLEHDFASLEILHGKELERDVREGRLHTGPGSVVQFIARK